MKAKTNLFLLLVLFSMTLLSCKKGSTNLSDTGNNNSEVLVTTYTPQDITSSTAVCGGDAILTQAISLSEIGICWSKENSQPTADDNHSSSEEWSKPFVYKITGLSPKTKYYVRAYALRGLIYYYGDVRSFTTDEFEYPNVTTKSVTAITYNSAKSGGNVSDEGDGSVTQKGVCWSTKHNPVQWSTNHYTTDGSGLGSFNSSLTGLLSDNTYYVRAYATSYNDQYGAARTAYGEEFSFTTATAPQIWQNGTLPGVFSIGNGKQIKFSQGNLQYRATTNTWRFADNQLIFIGNENESIASNYSGWIDLFGWGTGNNPTNSSLDNNDYSYFTDWGNNPISNGSNSANIWRSLSKNEWTYLLTQRNTSSGIRYAFAQINEVNGIMLIPDNWNSGVYAINNANNNHGFFTDNIISLTNWESILEQNGAVFLPANGFRIGNSYHDVWNDYWTNTQYEDHNGCSYMLEFMNSSLGFESYPMRTGCSVRLVCEI